MPKVALTKEQKMQREIERLANIALDALNSDQGRRRMTNKEYTDVIGVGERTLSSWNKGKLKGVAFDSIFAALIRAGYSPKIVLEANQFRGGYP